MLWSIAAVLNCEFLYFYIPNSYITVHDTNNTEFDSNTTVDFEYPVLDPNGETKVSFGVWKFVHPFVKDRCVAYSDAENHGWGVFPQEVPLQNEIARWSITLSSIFSIWALFLLFVEVCCCRFVCSRVLINMALLCALLGVPPAFLLYTGGLCNIFSKTSYSCNMGEGAIQALVSAGLLFITIILSCVTPKSIPVIRVIQEREKRMVHDPCCFNCCKARCPGKSKEEIYEEDPDLLLAKLPQDHVEVRAEGGKGGTYTYKHYYNDQAGGVTLQSQYIAASQQWLHTETNYTAALDRFKEDCRDAAQFTRTDNNPESNWRNIIQIPLEEVKDPELARQRLVLATLKNNCEQARGVMDRIEADLEEHIMPDDQKIQAALMDIGQEEEVEPVPEDEESPNADGNPDELNGEAPPDVEAAAVGAPQEANDAAETEKDVFVNANDSVHDGTFTESFSPEDNAFKSAHMAMDESNIKEANEEEVEQELRKSWVSSMFYSTTASQDDNYKKLT